MSFIRITLSAIFLVALTAGCDRSPSTQTRSASASTQSDRSSAPIAALLERLCDRPQRVSQRRSSHQRDSESSPDLYFSSTFGVCQEALELIYRRFEATDAICAELDRCTPSARTAYVDALYRILAVSADPATVPWLRQKMQDEMHAAYVYGSWLPEWSRKYSPDTAFLEREWQRWLTEPERWSTFFQSLYHEAPSAQLREGVLHSMSLTLFDSEMVAFFHSIERNPQTPTGERLLAARYLISMSHPVNADLFADALAWEAGHEIPSYPQWPTAFIVCHEAELPHILDYADRMQDSGTTGYQDPVDMFRRVALQDDLASIRECRDWYDRHKHETRAVWMAERLRAIDDALGEDPQRAQELMRSTWNVDFAQDWEAILAWTGHRVLADELTQFVCRGYRSCCRSNITTIVEAILSWGRDDLSPSTVRMLQQLDFLPDPEKPTWKEYVRRRLQSSF